MRYIKEYEKSAYKIFLERKFIESMLTDLTLNFKKLLDNLYTTFLNGNEIAINFETKLKGNISYTNYTKITFNKNSQDFEILFYGQDVFDDIINLIRKKLKNKKIVFNSAHTFEYNAVVYILRIDIKNIEKSIDAIKELEQSEDFQVYVSSKKYNL